MTTNEALVERVKKDVGEMVAFPDGDGWPGGGFDSEDEPHRQTLDEFMEQGSIGHLWPGLLDRAARAAIAALTPPAAEGEVTQADRDAAQSSWDAIADEHNQWAALSLEEQLAWQMSFARHRLAHSAPKVAGVEEALREMVYEATHLSPCQPNGNHDCTITARTLARARLALAAAPSAPGSGEG